jgi:hypothetical protein
LLIVAVMHCRREPEYWKKRVPERASPPID